MGVDFVGCCIFHKPRAFGESDSDETSSDEEEGDEGEGKFQEMKNNENKPAPFQTYHA